MNNEMVKRLGSMSREGAPAQGSVAASSLNKNTEYLTPSGRIKIGDLKVKKTSLLERDTRSKQAAKNARAMNRNQLDKEKYP